MVGKSSPFVFCNKIRVFVTLSDFSQNLAKVWQGQKNSDLIARGERATLSDRRFELSYTSLGPKLTEIGFLFVCLLSSAFLQSFRYCSFSLVKRTIIVVIFFSNFQGFTLLSWQKVGRIWLGFAGNHSSFSNFSSVCLYISVKFFPSPSPYSNDMAPKWKFQIFPLWFGSQTLYFSFRLFKTQLLV